MFGAFAPKIYGGEISDKTCPFYVGNPRKTLHFQPKNWALVWILPAVKSQGLNILKRVAAAHTVQDEVHPPRAGQLQHARGKVLRFVVDTRLSTQGYGLQGGDKIEQNYSVSQAVSAEDFHP